MVVGIRALLGVVVRVARPVIQARRHQHIGLEYTARCAQTGELARDNVHPLAPWRGEAADFLRRTQSGKHGGESGQQHPHRTTLCAQRCGQSPGHIGQTTGFKQGKEFGADLENAHVRDAGRAD